MAKLRSTASATIVGHIKSWFARNGVPLTVISDNGPQFSSEAFRRFSRSWDFTHLTSSPLYPQSNGAAERAVQTVKQLLKKSPDPFLALLAYRSTPLAGGYSPSELLQGRRLRTPVPAHPSLLQPRWPDIPTFKRVDQQSKLRQKAYFDTRHRARGLPELNSGDGVWVRDTREKGTILQAADTPRSYYVDMGMRTIRRNRRDLTATHSSGHAPAEPVLPDTEDEPAAPDCPETGSPLPVLRRYPERLRHPPSHLKDFVTNVE